MQSLRNSTILFLIRSSEGKITEICLAMKKRGFGVGRWNGVGGKVLEGETIEEAMKRETMEEIEVEVQASYKVAELSFYFPHDPDWDQKGHVYFCKEWKGEPTESEEMRPKWYSVSDIPFDKMWPDDIFWLPEVLKGKFATAEFVFGKADIIEKQDIRFS